MKKFKVNLKCKLDKIITISQVLINHLVEALHFNNSNNSNLISIHSSNNNSSDKVMVEDMVTNFKKMQLVKNVLI